MNLCGVKGSAQMIAPITDTFNVVPSDSDELPFLTRCITVTGDGIIRGITENRHITDTNEDTIEVTAIPGLLIPFRFKKIYATGTTATGITAGF